MSEKIIFIEGVADPLTHKNVVAETAYLNSCARTLEQGGHHVTRVGRAWGGFYMRHLREAFHKVPDASLIIINAHGNAANQQHYFGARREKPCHIKAVNFCGSLAEFSSNKALNVFMLSCRAGCGIEMAAKQLPAGSTFVSFVDHGEDVRSSISGIRAYDLKHTRDEPVAEQFFLNLLARNQGQNLNPQIAVCSNDPSQNRVWSLWDLVHDDIFTQTPWDDGMKASAVNFLKPYFCPKVLEEAFWHKEFFEHNLATHFEGIDIPELPAIIAPEEHSEPAREHLAEVGFLGAMCAVGYYRHRSAINAFKLRP